MTKPDHFREQDICGVCKYCKIVYHHCSACSTDDEYKCLKHDFPLSSYERDNFVCNDYEDSSGGLSSK